MNTIRVSNSLDPGQARHLVRPDILGPDLGSNCFQKLSAEDTNRQVKVGVVFGQVNSEDLFIAATVQYT